LRDILDAIEAIEAYSVSSYEEFLADAKTQDAILYNLIIIGEAANQVSAEFQERYHTIPWSSMIGTRNIIAHGYDQVKLQIHRSFYGPCYTAYCTIADIQSIKSTDRLARTGAPLSADVGKMVQVSLTSFTLSCQHQQLEEKPSILTL